MTIKEAREKLDKGEITALELTKACLGRIKKADKDIKALLSVCEEEALAEAEMADLRIKKGEKGALLGIPYVAKDNILTKGVKTTAASKILENYIAPFDATVIKKLREAGAVLLGKANLDEFAHGASTENSAFGPSHNPWDKGRVPGGSSGGSASAVAGDMCLFSLGTDTGGSIRCPSSFCGVVGVKPTYGRASRFGLIAMTSSTDVPGPITKTVEDAGLVLSVLAGSDENDATTPQEQVPEYTKNLSSNSKKIKLGVPEEFFGEGVDEEVKKLVETAIKKYEDLGAEIIPIKLPHNKYAIPVYYIITPAEISSNLARFDGIRYGFSDQEVSEIKEIYTQSRGRGLGAETKRRIMLGTYTLSAGYKEAYYLQAQKVRTKIKEELDSELENLDAILTPTQPDVAFKIGEQSDDPLKMYLEDVFVSAASLAGLPAISLPCGFSRDMPVGMQLIGKRFDEETLFKLGYLYQQNTDWHTHKPKI